MIVLRDTIRTYMVKYKDKDFLVQGILENGSEEVGYKVFPADTTIYHGDVDIGVNGDAEKIIAEVKDFEFSEALLKNIQPIGNS